MAEFLSAHPNLEVTLQVAREVPRQAQEVTECSRVSRTFARVSKREPTELDQLGLGRLQSKAELPQPKAQGVLHVHRVI